MKAGPQLRIGRFLKAVRHAERSLLLLDYDGTLAPFRQQRDQAFPYPGIQGVLQEIADSNRTRVVIVSGRDVSETVPLLDIEPSPEVWGLHGLQRRKVDGTIQTVHVEQRYLEALCAAERWLGYQQMRQAAEFKTGSIAVHWRGLSDRKAEELRARALLGWKPIADGSGLEFLDFDGGIEIRAPQANKGDVVRLVLSEMEPGTPAAYLGDDATDEHAFRAIRGRGLSVLVRPVRRPTAAQLWMKPPEELFVFLNQWLRAIRREDALPDDKAVAAALSK